MKEQDGSDYHWLRQDKDGGWSHKMGLTPATRHDDNGSDIADPETAVIGTYKSCKLYFCVCRDIEVAMVTPEIPSGGAEVAVFALIYSGRNDPSWTLSGNQIESLASKIASLPLSDRRPVARPGYDGFLLSCPAETGLPSHILATQGLISTPFVGEDHWYEDVNHLESWLLTLVGQQRFAEEVRSAMMRAPSAGHIRRLPPPAS